MTYIVSSRCIGKKDQSCAEVCPVDCIHMAQQMAVIDPAQCIDCGACLPECPVEAIFQDESLPPEYEPYREVNRAYRDGVERVDDLVAALARAL